MIADGSHPLPDSVPADQDVLGRDTLNDLDASTDLTDLGSIHLDEVRLDDVHLDGQRTDIDGDAIDDLTSIDTDDGLVVLGDHDHDGMAERLTVVDRTGHFATWEFCTAEDGSTRWQRTTHGTVGGI